MKLSLTLFAALCLSAPATELVTSYQSETKLRVTISSETESEVTDFRLERNGEPIEGRGGGMGGGSEVTQTIVYVDEILAVADGEPSELRRSFEELTRTSSNDDGEDQADAPLDGTTLLLSSEEGEVDVELVDGSVDDDALLEGHRMTLLLDAFLPEQEVEPGDSWSLEGEAVQQVLGLDMQSTYFPRPEREPDMERERGGRRGGGGRRRSGRQGRLLQQADWSGTAKLLEGEEVVEGDACRIIEIELTGSASLEEESGGGRRGFAFGSSMPAPETTIEFEITWKGRMAFSAEALRPVSLELDGDYTSELETERQRGDMTMTIYRLEEGSLSYQISIEDLNS